MSVLYSHSSGQGEPIVLIHGLGHRHQVWRALTDLLVASELEVISLDLPGHGASSSSWRPSSYSVDATVARIVETFDSLGLQRPHVVGNSLGGLVALELAARGHARSVTALAPAGFSPPSHLLRAGAALAANRIRFARAPRGVQGPADLDLSLLPGPRESAGFVARLRSLHSWAGFVGYLPHALLARFRSPLSVPTTVVWGDHDPILNTAGLRTAAEHNPGNISWVELPNCGHFPMTEAPGPTACLVLETVERARTTR